MLPSRSYGDTLGIIYLVPTQSIPQVLNIIGGELGNVTLVLNEPLVRYGSRAPLRWEQRDLASASSASLPTINTVGLKTRRDGRDLSTGPRFEKHSRLPVSNSSTRTVAVQECVFGNARQNAANSDPRSMREDIGLYRKSTERGRGRRIRACI